VLVACVAENRLRDHREVLLLFRSLVRLGGSLAACRKAAWFVEHIDPHISRQLAVLGVETRVVSRLNSRCPHANKIRMLTEADDAVDWVVALDTDIAVAGDFSARLGGGTVRAKPVDYDPLPRHQWHQLFDYFGLRLPPERYLTTFDRAETIAYFNSGVLLVPRPLATELGAAWASFVGLVLDAYPDLPSLAPHAFFTDQFALTLALADRGIHVDTLPLALNFPTHRSIDGSFQPDDVRPLILHHHHRMTSEGELLICGYRAPDDAITAVNAATNPHHEG
jgi:hypothetical protein